MIFLSLWVTADAGGGLKIRAHQHPDLQGLGGGSHQQASDGIYRGIACRRYCRTPFPVTAAPRSIISTILLYFGLN